MKKNDFTGKRFGRLIALFDSGERRNKAVVWKCICDCGNENNVIMNDLKRGMTKSCGCLHDENAKTVRFKHGEGRTPLYIVWRGIKTRCLNPRDKTFKYYGAKGIKICSLWKNDYLAFKDWATCNGYKKGLSIDRINNKGNYAPENCRWITVSENINKRWHGDKNV